MSNWKGAAPDCEMPGLALLKSQSALVICIFSEGGRLWSHLRQFMKSGLVWAEIAK